MLKGTSNLVYIFVPKGETNKTSNYQQGKYNIKYNVLHYFLICYGNVLSRKNTSFVEKMRI